MARNRAGTRSPAGQPRAGASSCAALPVAAGVVPAAEDVGAPHELSEGHRPHNSLYVISDAGARMVDVRDPYHPKEVAFYIPATTDDTPPTPAVEAALASDANNCGKCANACRSVNGQPACVSGTCTAGSCNTGFGDCDPDYRNGCETATTTPPAAGITGLSSTT